MHRTGRTVQLEVIGRDVKNHEWCSMNPFSMSHSKCVAVGYLSCGSEHVSHSIFITINSSLFFSILFISMSFTIAKSPVSLSIAPHTRLFSYVGQDTETFVIMGSPDIMTRTELICAKTNGLWFLQLFGMRKPRRWENAFLLLGRCQTETV